ncbi:MAG: hypothetical protein REI94_15285 [Moraxellaceae bacterium]|nr:hypothetical protein [Moraxellaceae bacterium]
MDSTATRQQDKPAMSLFILALIALAAAPAQASERHTRSERIAQGVASGSLTAREARGLKAGQQALRTERQAYASDGRINAAERADLRNDANRLDRQIYNQKHDAQVVGRTLAPAVDASQHRQGHRIAQGVRSGELTRSEAQTLGAERRAIRSEERAYRADGVLTRAERQDLRGDQREASANIYEEKHDAERRQ